MAAREMKQKPKNESGGGGGEGRVSFLSSSPLPALLLTPFFVRSLTLVPRSLLLNRMETLATQASYNSSWRRRAGEQPLHVSRGEISLFKHPRVSAAHGHADIVRNNSKPEFFFRLKILMSTFSWKTEKELEPEIKTKGTNFVGRET